MRMDHHCMWINNCVGIDNHKYYTLYTFYLFCFFALNNISLLYYIYMNKTSIFDDLSQYKWILLASVLSSYGLM